MNTIGSTTEPAAPRARTYGGRSPEERRADRRRRLLDAALELFGTEGFAPVAINRICAVSGVTARHFYEDFPSREALLLALYDDIMADVFAQVQRAVQTAPPDFATLTEAGLGAYVHALLDDPRRARVCCIESNGVSRELSERTQSLYDLFAGLVLQEAARLHDSGEPVTAEQSTFVAMVLVGGTNQAMASWLHTEPSPPIGLLIEELTRVYVAVGTMPGKAEWRARRRAERATRPTRGRSPR